MKTKFREESQNKSDITSNVKHSDFLRRSGPPVTLLHKESPKSRKKGATNVAAPFSE